MFPHRTTRERGAADGRPAEALALRWPDRAWAPTELRLGPTWERPIAPIVLALTVMILGLGVAILVAGIARAPHFGQDFGFYRDAGTRWLAGGSFYLDRQLHGPYELTLMVDNLYPPTALALFVPLALLPAPLAALAWWGLPVTLLAYQLRKMSPAAWAWPLLALLLAWPRSGGAVIFGNTDLWMAAAVAAATLWGWPAILVTLKPAFAPLVVVGAHRRPWWIGAALMALVSLFLLPEWIRYFDVIRDSGVTPAYSVGGMPLILLPLVAWLTRRP